jgi:hypothetical protein
MTHRVEPRVRAPETTPKGAGGDVYRELSHLQLKGLLILAEAHKKVEQLSCSVDEAITDDLLLRNAMNRDNFEIATDSITPEQWERIAQSANRSAPATSLPA